MNEKTQRKEAKRQRREENHTKRSAPLLLSALIFVFLLAAAVRFHNLDAQSFWNDEGISYVQSLRTLPEIVVHAARDIHPPLYYVLLAVWRIFTGETEFALRALSVFLSLLSVALAYALGKRLYSPTAGLAAALFVSLNTFSIYYAQELRMYSLLAVIAAASMWVFVEVMTHAHRQGIWRSVLALGLLNTVGLYTQYSYPLVIAAQGALLVLRIIIPSPSAGAKEDESRMKALAAFVLACLLTLVLYLPWLQTAWVQITSQPNIAQPIPTAEAITLIFGWLSFGMTYTFSSPSPAVWFFLLFGLLTLPEKRDGRWRMAVPIAWVVIAVGAFLTLGLYLRYLRFLLPVQIAFAVWMGRGVWVLWGLATSERILSRKPADQQRLARLFMSLPQRAFVLQFFTRTTLLRTAAVVGAFSVLVSQWGGLDPLYSEAQFRRADYRGIARDITAEFRPGDAVILDAPNQAEVFGYYYAGDAPVFSLPTSADDAQTQAKVRDLIAGYDRLFVVFWGEAERDPNRIVESTLDGEAFEASDGWYGDVRLAKYATPAEFTQIIDSGARFGEAITLKSYALSATQALAGDILQVQLEWQTSSPLDTRYKVFVQLLNPDGTLAAQRDSEPGGGLSLTTDWKPGEPVVDNHALMIPNDLTPAHYVLIVGLYDINNPQARLPVGDADYLKLETINITQRSGGG